MAVQIISEEDLYRNRMAFAKRRKVAIAQETDKLEKMIDKEVSSRLHKGMNLPYTVTFAIPEAIMSKKDQSDFLDADDYFLAIVTELRDLYRKAGWASKVKRTADQVQVILDRPRGTKSPLLEADDET
ncbi:MAG: hypothetical protein HQL84_08255 [Magnetococcales bacterium]|nr:hypothetical protein [Magnetococcales bacterium]MBF0150021.1 hypothetical protein [Magnetococcales bacterium]MBF0175097.1 hypothetical protein [Magnetococcales bacterium]MBF0629533.1 hypothetical protein [Magnetococcales bacterium]